MHPVAFVKDSSVFIVFLSMVNLLKASESFQFRTGQKLPQALASDGHSGHADVIPPTRKPRAHTGGGPTSPPRGGGPRAS